MDIGSIFLILALLILTGLYIARPFLEHRSRGVTQEEHELSALLAERDRILNSLAELDFDHSLGKIPEEDYPLMRQALLRRGAAVLRQLDEYQKGYGERLQAALAEPAAATSQPKPAEADDPIEALLAKRRQQRESQAGGFCPQCGSAVTRSDRFCPKCGTALKGN
ncbi:MAG: zinc ribbon domain-containing protein [Anaerolineae bacterium]|nr:MAG: zinc ribbon domain-containing protein [Anaerolineae bacterium]